MEHANNIILHLKCYCCLANYPPEITNGNVTLEVTVGETKTLQLEATDKNTGDIDKIYFVLNSDAPSGLTIDNTSKILTWTNVPELDSATIQITVSDGKAQSLWTPKIELCRCQVNKYSTCIMNNYNR